MQQDMPSFSVIVPTYNRPKQLQPCLRSLAGLDYPSGRFEVIVVDDGSSVSMESVVASISDTLNVRLVTQRNAGPATARNTGATHAKGEFLAFIDDDCSPAPDWLHALAKRVAITPDCIIGGRTVNALPGNPFSMTSQTLIDYLYAYYNADPGQARFVTSNNLAVSADRLHAIQGFDTAFGLAGGEDRALCDRWLRHGHRIVYAPEVVVFHAHALTFRTFCKQHFNYGCGAFHFHGKRDRCDRGHARLEPTGFYLDLLRYPFAKGRNRRQALLLGALLMVSQAATATGYFWQMAHQALPRNRLSAL